MAYARIPVDDEIHGHFQNSAIGALRVEETHTCNITLAGLAAIAAPHKQCDGVADFEVVEVSFNEI